MENELLKGILEEIKGLREDTIKHLSETNARIDRTNEELNKTIAGIDQTNKYLEQTNVRIDQTNEQLQQTNARIDQTNKQLDQTNAKVEQINVRLDQTNLRIDKTNESLHALRESVIVLQQGVNDLRYEMQGVKQILGEKVIWQNDNIVLQTKEGKSIYGLIKRASKEK